MSVDRILNVTWWRDETAIELNGRHLFFNVNNQVCLIIPGPPNFGLSWRLSGPLLLETFLGQVINCRGNALLTIAGKIRAKAWHWILRLIVRWPGFDSQNDADYIFALTPRKICGTCKHFDVVCCQFKILFTRRYDSNVIETAVRSVVCSNFTRK